MLHWVPATNTDWFSELPALNSIKLWFVTFSFRGMKFIWWRGNLFQIRSERGVD